MAEGKLGPCMQCVRFMLFVFNALFWVSLKSRDDFSGFDFSLEMSPLELEVFD